MHACLYDINAWHFGLHGITAGVWAKAPKPPYCVFKTECRRIAMIGLLRAFSFLLVAGVFAQGECQNCEVEQVTLLQSKQSTRGQNIIVKGPSASGGTASQNLAPTCAEGFNAAYAKCLGGTNSYLMILVTNDDDTKAYCAYTGGWAQTTENYPDHDACFASPGENQALYFDSASQTLVNWNKETVVSAPLKQDYTSLSCSASGEAPCKSTVAPKYARQLTKEPQRWTHWTVKQIFTATCWAFTLGILETSWNLVFFLSLVEKAPGHGWLS